MLGLDWRHDPTYRLSLGLLNRDWNVTVSEWSNTLIRRVCVCVCVCVGHSYITSSPKPFNSSPPLTFPHGNDIYTSRWIINKMNHKEFQITSQRTRINTTINSVNVRPHTEPHVRPEPRQSEHGDAWTNIDLFFIYFQNHYPAIHFMLLKNTCSGRWTFSCNSLWIKDVRTIFNLIYFLFFTVVSSVLFVKTSYMFQNGGSGPFPHREPMFVFWGLWGLTDLKNK